MQSPFMAPLHAIARQGRKNSLVHSMTELFLPVSYRQLLLLSPGRILFFFCYLLSLACRLLVYQPLSFPCGLCLTSSFPSSIRTRGRLVHKQRHVVLFCRRTSDHCYAH